MTALARLLGAVSLTALVIAVPRAAFADRRSEAAARDALKRADEEYMRTDFAKGLRRLQTAERACGEASCTSETHATLLREIGTMQFRLGQADAATASFQRARKVDPNIDLNPDYDAKDLRAAWDAALASAAPATKSGDFVHRPAAGQRTERPLPVYVELQNPDVTSVVVKYRNPTMRAYRRAVLRKMGGGWGGYVPCADVVPGILSYYVQGFDKTGELAASSGDPGNTFEVPIRADYAGAAPALPGDSPPTKCSDEDVEALNLDEGERCKEDRQCRSGTCTYGRCKAVPAFEQEEPSSEAGPRQRARLWIGVAGTLDLTMPKAANEVCALSGGTSPSGYWCTTPEGADLTGRPALVAGRQGTTSGDLTTGSVHIVLTLDYALTGNVLLGLRLGYVANAYPGDAASAAGKTLAAHIHVEARGTWVFGDEPIARSGLAPYVFGSVGAAHFDAPVTVMVAAQGVAGERAVHAWDVTGPAFAALGGGARYAFSPRVAFSAGLGAYAAFAPGAFGFDISPELNLNYGF